MSLLFNCVLSYFYLFFMVGNIDGIIQALLVVQQTESLVVFSFALTR